MEELRLRQPAVRPRPEPRPCRAVVVTAAPERAPPEPFDIAEKSGRSRAVGGHRVVGEAAPHDLCQPPGLRQRPCSAAGSCRRLRSSSLISLSLAFIRLRRVLRRSWNFPLRLFAQICVKPGKSPENPGSPACQGPASSASLGGEAPELDELVRVQRQSLLLEASLQVRPKAPGIRPVLDSDDEIIGITHDDDIATGITTGVALTPLLCPAVQDMVQVDVREPRRDHRAAFLVMGASLADLR